MIKAAQQCTLKVLFSFCPVLSEFSMFWVNSYHRVFYILAKTVNEKANLGLTFLHFEFSDLYLDIVGQKKSYFTKMNVFEPTMQIQGFIFKM